MTLTALIALLASAPVIDGRGKSIDPSAIPEGMHLRMNGKKELLSEIKGMEGSRIEITGLVKKGQMAPDGVRIAPGVRITAGSPSTVGGSIGPSPSVNQIMIDVEGWRHVAGECRSR